MKPPQLKSCSYQFEASDRWINNLSYVELFVKLQILSIYAADSEVNLSKILKCLWLTGDNFEK